jgi:hypothetical protein
MVHLRGTQPERNIFAGENFSLVFLNDPGDFWFSVLSACLVSGSSGQIDIPNSMIKLLKKIGLRIFKIFPAQNDSVQGSAGERDPL